MKFIPQQVPLYREISSGNLTNHGKTKQLCSDDVRTKKMEKKTQMIQRIC